MSHILKLPVSQGYVSTGTNAPAADSLDSGELVSMSGAFYRKNDPDTVWKMPGRSTFGVAGSGAVKGLAICQFDEGGTDKLIASVGTTWVSATPGQTGTFSSLVTGLDPNSTRFTACQQSDRWFLGNGYDTNKVLLPAGTTREMGLKPPAQGPTCVASAVSVSVERPSSNEPISATLGWSNPTNASDTDEWSFASVTASRSTNMTLSNNRVAIYTNHPQYSHKWFNWSASSTSGRTMRVKWSMPLATFDIPEILFEKSEDGGASWTQIFLAYPPYATTVDPNWVTSPITADSSLVQFRAGIRTRFTQATVYIHSIIIDGGSSVASFDTTTGIFYAITEYNSDTAYGPDGMESPLSGSSGLLTFTTSNSVVVTRPSITNPAATHWRVYRTTDGAENTWDNFGLLQTVPIANTTWTDPFDVLITEQPLPIVPLVDLGGLIYFRDSPPPPFINMISWRGSICGISRTNRRAWYFSEGGFPESFPAPYVVTSFPLDQHDGIVGQMAIGETLVILCEGALLGLDDIPRVTDGQFNNTDARPLRGHPGCVGNYAYTTYSVKGEPRGAWVSPFGIYITNGSTCEYISTDLAWETEVNVSALVNSVLRWDAKNLILWFEFDYDGDGLNDREVPIHMAEAHQKKDGKPKLGQPTAKASSCMASALISASHYRFSGHPSDGTVYVEEMGTTDAATGSEVVMDVKTGQITSDKVDLAVIKATVQHSDFGDGITGTFVGTFYRDSSNSSNSRSQSIRLDGNRGTTVGMGRSGELCEFELTYSGTGTGGFSGIDIEVDGQGRSGSAPRVTSNSATP